MDQPPRMGHYAGPVERGRRPGTRKVFAMDAPPWFSAPSWNEKMASASGRRLAMDRPRYTGGTASSHVRPSGMGRSRKLLSDKSHSPKGVKLLGDKNKPPKGGKLLGDKRMPPK